MAGPRRRRNGLRLLWAAFAVGGLHAAFSLYWAVGGRWLLDTVGEEAVEMADERPVAAFAILSAAFAVKATGAVVPVLVERARGGLVRRIVRTVSWAAGAFLVVYGRVLTVVSAAVLSGVISVEGPVDRRGLTGHAVLWDPLFLVWGALLLAGLGLTRRPRDQLADESTS